MAETPKRPRVMFDCPEEIRRAIKIRAAKTGQDPSQIIVTALRAAIGKEIGEALEVISSEEPPPPSRRGRKPKSRED